MSQTLRDFIASREGEIKAQIKALNDELRELTIAKSALSGTTMPLESKGQIERLTQRDMIIAVLDDEPFGATSDRVIDLIRTRFGVEIAQSTMSSQLSRAKSAGLLTLDAESKTWSIATSTPETKEPPEGGSKVTGEATTSPEQSEHDDQRDMLSQYS